MASGERAVVGRIDDGFSAAEREVLRALDALDADGTLRAWPAGKAQVARDLITSHDALNEAFDYPLPSSFSRGLAVTLGPGQRILWISGTASIDDAGDTVHVGDLRAQTWRTFFNITKLLDSQGATWHDIVRTTCYLRDIERDYDEFNKVRTLFYKIAGLDPLPASTGIQARLCRSDLLIEIECFAVVNA